MAATAESSTDLPRDWYEFVIMPGVDCRKPGLYEWRIERAGSYIGKYGRIRRPTRQYGRNVYRLLNGLAYRAGNPDGFRRVHHELAAAHREGRRIELIILENVDGPAMSARELEVIAERGSLNDPPYAGRRSAPRPQQPASELTRQSNIPARLGSDRMAEVDVAQWLEGWVENNLSGPGAVQSAAEIESQADVCVAEAAVAGISSDELKKVAEGNLASYLAGRASGHDEGEVGRPGRFRCGRPRSSASEQAFA
ncbi:hypothetical protein JNW90_13240 [Micromonospora sp. STR1s_5]|nr:hypothetical protein [Micromonospora sp. STR1s_5]